MQFVVAKAKRCLAHVPLLAALSFIHVYAHGQVQPGTYTGTLSCGELLSEQSRPGWTDKVQVEVNGSQLTWSRAGSSPANGSSQYSETGTANISSEGKAFIDAQGRFLPGSTQTGSWITQGELIIENGRLVGQNLTQLSPNRHRITRRCTASIPVQVNVARAETDRQQPVNNAEQNATSMFKAKGLNTRVEVQSEPPANPAFAPDASKISTTDVAIPKSDIAYICRSNNNRSYTFFSGDGKYYWANSEPIQGQIQREQNLNDISVGRWNINSLQLKLDEEGVYFPKKSQWNIDKTQWSYYVQQEGLTGFTLALRKDRMMYDCEESPKISSEFQNRLKLAYEGLASHKANAKVERVDNEKYYNIRTIEEASKPLQGFLLAITKMKQIPSCSTQARVAEFQYRAAIKQLVETDNIPLARKSWFGAARLTALYAENAQKSLENCAKR